MKPLLPALNAALNALSMILLLYGYIAIKRNVPHRHKKFMLAAIVSSALFLSFYLFYHAQAGSMPYPHQDWTRALYLIILVPHIILAALMVPFILAALYLALNSKFTAHKRIARWLWPVWMYVSLSGVIIYFMLYQF